MRLLAGFFLRSFLVSFDLVMSVSRDQPVRSGRDAFKLLYTRRAWGGSPYADFPRIGVPINGVTYLLQQLVLWQWFTDQVPSSAYGGWYSFPYPPGLTVPAVYCQ